MEKYNSLIEGALSARNYSYAPFSGFRVGACIETAEGKLFSGCNVENSSYSATNCAERTAIFKAVSEGYRDFLRIAIVGGKDEITDFCPPCGVCRQVMMEFCDVECFEIILAKSPDEYQVHSLRELLPMGFKLL